MCDKEHFNTLEGRLDALEDSVNVYHAKTDEKIKTLFKACAEMSETASHLMKFGFGLLSFIVVVAILALVYGAVGNTGFNAVTHAASNGAMVK